jgi:hypothetical protein
VDQACVFTHYLLLITHYSKAVLKGQGFRPNYEGKWGMGNISPLSIKSP